MGHLIHKNSKLGYIICQRETRGHLLHKNSKWGYIICQRETRGICSTKIVNGVI